MKKFILLLITGLALMAASSLAASYSSLTTTQNGPYQKAIYVTLAAVDENGQQGTILLDNRVTGGGPQGVVVLSSLSFTGSAKGTFTGFTHNPDGTRKPFTGQAQYVGTGITPNGQAYHIFGVFNYHAFYNNVCTGKGCPTVGWHYSIDAGSMATVQFDGTTP